MSLQLHERAALMMVVGLAHDRYMTIAHRCPTDVVIDPISFAFPEQGKTSEAAEFLRQHGYKVRLNNKRCHIMELSEDHYVDEDKEAANEINPATILGNIHQEQEGGNDVSSS
jgi:hypothetical protein